MTRPTNLNALSKLKHQLRKLQKVQQQMNFLVPNFYLHLWRVVVWFQSRTEVECWCWELVKKITSCNPRKIQKLYTYHQFICHLSTVPNALQRPILGWFCSSTWQTMQRSTSFKTANPSDNKQRQIFGNLWITSFSQIKHSKQYWYEWNKQLWTHKTESKHRQ